MNRRNTIKLISSTVFVSTGCLNNDSGENTSDERISTTQATDSKDSPTTARNPETNPCEMDHSAIMEKNNQCSNLIINFAGIDSKPQGDTESAKTALNFNDYVSLRFSLDIEEKSKMYGCIDTAEKGNVGVEQILDENTKNYELQFGPFSHNGVNRFEFWIEGCSEKIIWPKPTSTD